MSQNLGGRPEKHTVDYFQHDCHPKDTLKILEDKWKNDGYAFWFKLLETLGRTKGHFLDLNEKSKLILLSSKTFLDESKCLEILNLLSDLGAIDPKLWGKKIVWSQNFIDRISHLYNRRINGIPAYPDEKIAKKNGSK